jgi:beta-galactosidase
MRKILLGILLSSATCFAQQHREVVLDDNWLFSRDQQSWQIVSVPHDWAISGPFDKKWDLQRVAIEQNGEKEATEKSGRSGALPWIGKGYYRRTFQIPADFKGHAELLFDGAMAEPVVRVNGQEAGSWAYGYNSFRIDVSHLVKSGDNLMEVALQNVEESSRWYPGAGIYRPVTLILTPTTTYLEDWSIFVKPVDEKKVKEGKRVLMKVNFNIVNATKKLSYAVSVIDDKGNVLQRGKRKYDLEAGNGKVDFLFPVNNARLWSPESPVMYKMVLSLYDGKQLIDQKTQRFGIRTVTVSKDGGFQLNGVTRKIKGVCLHHDLGPLGSAVNKSALIRQVKMMKEMGCDAIRTAHNMPSQMQMDVCDSLGMMVMAESFDMWIYPKCKNGYARFFKEWSDRDMERLVVAHRNHPSIVMWSIGNEIPEQWSDEGRRIAQHLQDICHRLDPTRPVTQGMDRADAALKSGFAQVMDVPGFNYRVHKYQNNIKQLPQGFLLGSETASTVSSRGIYKFPVKPDDNSRYASYSPHYDPKAIRDADGQCSGYDVEYCPWSNLPDDDWVMQDDYPWVIGEFVWTGYDYLGEPSPYDEYWPSRSSYFGICDLAGLPKDRYWLYRSKWQTQDHTIHLVPHWTWGKERLGEVTPIYCYTDYPEAELFVNGISQGKRTKGKEQGRLDRYRLRWNDVRYEPGEVKVVVYDAQGKACGEKVLRTAGKPADLELDVWTQHDTKAKDKSFLWADGNDLAFITVSLTDQDGNIIPNGDDALTFDVTGAGQFKAVCNGDATSLEPFTQPAMHLFAGQLVVVLQAGREKGLLTLTVHDAKHHIDKQVTLQVQ